MLQGKGKSHAYLSPQLGPSAQRGGPAGPVSVTSTEPEELPLRAPKFTKSCALGYESSVVWGDSALKLTSKVQDLPHVSS